MDNEEREILYRLDEKTEYIHESVDKIDGRLDSQQEEINNVKSISAKNRNHLQTGIYVGTTLFAAVTAKMLDLIPI